MSISEESIEPVPVKTLAYIMLTTTAPDELLTQSTTLLIGGGGGNEATTNTTTTTTTTTTNTTVNEPSTPRVGRTRTVILPLRAGYESAFLGSSLHGLFGLPGCESALLGQHRPSHTLQTSKTNTDAGGANGEEDEEPHPVSSSSLTHTAQPLRGADALPVTDFTTSDFFAPPHRAAVSREETATTSTRGVEGGGEGTSGRAAAAATTANTATTTSANAPAVPLSLIGLDLQTAMSGEPRAEIGGIRCHWGKLVRTPASEMYRDFVLHSQRELHGLPDLDRLVQLGVRGLRGGAIRLDDGTTTTTVTTAAAGTQRVPLLLPSSTRATPTLSGPGSASGVALSQTRSPTRLPAITAQASSPSSTHQPSPQERERHTTEEAVQQNNGTTTTVTALCHAEGEAMDEAVRQEVYRGQTDLATAHFLPVSCPRRQYNRATTHAMAGAASVLSSGPNATGRASDVRCPKDRPEVEEEDYDCWASNSQANMPSFAFPQMSAFVLTELAEYLVTRSSVDANSATSIDLCKALGPPKAVARLPEEKRQQMYEKAMQLMAGASFLQM